MYRRRHFTCGKKHCGYCEFWKRIGRGVQYVPTDPKVYIKIVNCLLLKDDCLSSYECSGGTLVRAMGVFTMAVVGSCASWSNGYVFTCLFPLFGCPLTPPTLPSGTCCPKSLSVYIMIAN